MFVGCSIEEEYYFYDKRGSYFKGALDGQKIEIEYSEFKAALRKSILCKV